MGHHGHCDEPELRMLWEATKAGNPKGNQLVYSFVGATMGVAPGSHKLPESQDYKGPMLRLRQMVIPPRGLALVDRVLIHAGAPYDSYPRFMIDYALRDLYCSKVPTKPWTWTQ